MEKNLMKPLAEVPWYAKGTMEFLEMFIKPEMTALETGMGGSTIWLAQRVKYLISFENNFEWFEKVSEEIRSRNIDNVKLVYDEEYPQCGIPEKEDDFDLVFVDGRGRNNTMRSMIDRINPGGLLLLDNSQRSKYAMGKSLPQSRGWKEIVFESGLKNGWTTTIWLRGEK